LLLLKSNDWIGISPVLSADLKWKASIVISFTGQRMAQSPQRMQRVSSFTITAPVAIPAASSCDVTPRSSTW
jgi:hypothetical protein